MEIRRQARNPHDSPYSLMMNNPVQMVDPGDDSTVATSALSGSRMLSTIKGSFKGEKFDKLNGLFKLKKDGVTMAGIEQSGFDAATKGFSEDEAALAKGYLIAINSDEDHYIEMVYQSEELSEQTARIMGYDEGTKGSHVVTTSGGGKNAATGNGGSHSVVVMDNSRTFPVIGNNASISSSGDLLAHELLGHGLLRSLPYNAEQHHHQAVQTSNLYRRVNGNTNWRNGAHHGNPAYSGLPSDVARAIPTMFK